MSEAQKWCPRGQGFPRDSGRCGEVGVLQGSEAPQTALELRRLGLRAAGILQAWLAARGESRRVVSYRPVAGAARAQGQGG